MKTLIVEDDATSRIILQTTLKPFGPTEVQGTGKGAADRVKAARAEGVPFDLVTLDIMMPEVDGQTALREIRAVDTSCKIIMTTALDDQKNLMAAHEGRCDGYLVKPIRTAKLLELLRSLGLIA